MALSLKSRRGLALNRGLKKKGINLMDLAKALRTKEKDQKALRNRLQSCKPAEGKKSCRVLLPYELCLEIAPKLDMQPSDLFLEMTPREEKRNRAQPVAPPTGAEKKAERPTQAPAGVHIAVTLSVPELGIGGAKNGLLRREGEGYVLDLKIPVTAEAVARKFVPQ